MMLSRLLCMDMGSSKTPVRNYIDSRNWVGAVEVSCKMMMSRLLREYGVVSTYSIPLGWTLSIFVFAVEMGHNQPSQRLFALFFWMWTARLAGALDPQPCSLCWERPRVMNQWGTSSFQPPPVMWIASILVALWIFRWGQWVRWGLMILGIS